MRRLTVGTTVLGVAVWVTGCSDKPQSPAAPDRATAASETLAVASAATLPPFNLEAILRPADGGTGFGHVKFRQPADNQEVIYLDVWVRDLAPNTTYFLQRAVDTQLDGVCTGAGWLTLGANNVTPGPIQTDDKGTGIASLSRNVGAVSQPGDGFDIHFRVVEEGAAIPVLESGCYRFVVRL